MNILFSKFIPAFFPVLFLGFGLQGLDVQAQSGSPDPNNLANDAQLPNQVIASSLPESQAWILHFMAYIDGQRAIRLKWETSGFEKPVGFELWRSWEGGTYQQVAVARSNTPIAAFEVVDSTARSGRSEYFILIRDELGVLGWSSVRSVQLDPGSALRAYPLPADREVILICKDSRHQGQTVVVYNSSGKKISDFIVQNDLRIDIANWPSGTYFLIAPDGAPCRIVKQ